MSVLLEQGLWLACGSLARTTWEGRSSVTLAYSLTLVYLVGTLVLEGCSCHRHVLCRQRARHLLCERGRCAPCSAHTLFSLGRLTVNADEIVLPGAVEAGGSGGQGWVEAVWRGRSGHFSLRRRCLS